MTLGHLIRQPSAATSPKGRGLFSIPIITQIGRENKLSAEIYVSRTVEDAGPYKCNLPYEKAPKPVFFIFIENIKMQNPANRRFAKADGRDFKGMICGLENLLLL